VSAEVTDNPPARPQTLDEPAGRATPTIIVERPVCGIEIELMGGRRVRFDRDIDAETMRRVVSALARRYGIDLRLLFRWRRALGVGGIRGADKLCVGQLGLSDGATVHAFA